MTIRLRHSPADLVRLRFAISPMWETNAAVRLLARGAAGFPHGPWLRAARGRGGPTLSDPDLSGLVALMPRTGYTPDFLTPPPAGPGTTFAEELEAVRSTPPDRAHAEIGTSLTGGARLAETPPWLLGDPQEALDRLADTLAGAWEQLVQPAWERIRDLLEADIAHHSRRSSRAGAGAMLAGLDDRVSWSDADGVLTVVTPVEAERDLGGEGLVLMPSCFVWPNIAVVTDRPWRATLIYPARGVAGLWSTRSDPDRETVLARLLGARRALLLEVLSTPSTTSRLARSLAMSPGTVSEHLTVLRAAGLVSRRRTGRTVDYARTALGDSLVRG